MPKAILTFLSISCRFEGNSIFLISPITSPLSAGQISSTACNTLPLLTLNMISSRINPYRSRNPQRRKHMFGEWNERIEIYYIVFVYSSLAAIFLNIIVKTHRFRLKYHLKEKKWLLINSIAFSCIF